MADSPATGHRGEVLFQPATRRATPTPAPPHRQVGSVLVGAAAVLAAWAGWLGATLPDSALPQAWSAAWTGLGNWQLTWVGLDGLEVAGLLATGLALRRGHWIATVSALVSLPVFVLDAWFDVMTTTTSSGLRQALAMAVLVELPTAAALGWVARSGIRRLRATADDVSTRKAIAGLEDMTRARRG